MKKTKTLKKLKKPIVSEAVLPDAKPEDTAASASTIARSHYTKQGDHPEDRIYRDREYIHRLRAHMDEVYDALERDLRMKEGQNWLFDFVHNEDLNIEFEEYLAQYGIQYKDVVKSKGR